MVLTRSEKEQRIIEMYEAGHTIREIAREVHMSFGPIGNIIRKVTGDSGKDSNNEHPKSKETEALKLFQEGKPSVEVAIMLDISSDETEDLYLGYLRLKNLHQLVLIYKELKYQLPFFIKFFKHVKIARIKEEDVAHLINEAKQIPFLRKTFWDLTNANTNLQEQNNNLLSELSSVQNKVNVKRGYLQRYEGELKRIIFEIEERKRELQYLD
jgi:DNA-binding CsgD family transcriptional regulator